MGLDRNTLLVLLSVLSHARAEAADYCEVAYSVIARDTGLHKTIVCNAIKVMLVPLGIQAILVKRKKTKDATTTNVPVAVEGLGLLALAPRKEHRTKTGRPTSYVWRNGGPKYDTNVYYLGPLAERLTAILKPKPSGKVLPSRASFGLDVPEENIDIDIEAETGPDEEQDRYPDDWVTEDHEPYEEYDHGADDDEPERSQQYEQEP